MARRWIPVLAARNLLRYRRRTLITAGAIAFGLMMYIWVDSILAAAAGESVRNLRRYETAETMLAVPGYLKNRDSLPLDRSFQPEELILSLRSAGVSAAPRVHFGADLVFFKDPFPEDGNVPARISAVDPILDTGVFSLRDTVAEGRWLSDDGDEAVIGIWFAQAIGASLGATLIAVTETRDGYAQTIDLEIVGILDCPNPVVNREGFYIPLSTADRVLEMDGGITSLYLSWPGSESGRPVPKAASTVLEQSGLESSPWEEQAADYVAVMDAEHAGSGTVIMLILIIAAVGISNTMLMAVYERRREVGIMRAMGMSDGKIRLLFLWESAGIGALGSALGAVTGALVNIPLVKHGLDYSSFMKDSSFGYRIHGVFYGSWHLQGFLNAVLLGILLSVAVAALSIHRILRMDITSSLRSE
jgi:ABC-type lipoprotein release transport system permease subunit